MRHLMWVALALLDHCLLTYGAQGIFEYGDGLCVIDFMLVRRDVNNAQPEWIARRQRPATARSYHGAKGHHSSELPSPSVTASR